MKGKKTGGRKKGTPNHDNPVKAQLRVHSTRYVTPKPQVGKDGKPRQIEFRDKQGQIVSIIVLADDNGKPLVMSDLEVDILALEPRDRVLAELHILKFHTPEMKAVDVDMEMRASVLTIEDRIRRLSEEDDEEDEYDDL